MTANAAVLRIQAPQRLLHAVNNKIYLFFIVFVGRGNIAINAVSDGVVFNCYLSNIDRVSTFWQIMEQFSDNLRCCSNMISGFELQTACPQCGRGQPSKRGSATSAKRTYEMQSATKNSSSMVCISSTPDSTGMNAGESFEGRGGGARESPKRRREESGWLSMKTRTLIIV